MIKFKGGRKIYLLQANTANAIFFLKDPDTSYQANSATYGDSRISSLTPPPRMHTGRGIVDRIIQSNLAH